MNAKISNSADGQNTTLTIELPRIDVRKLIDRWTWDELTITLQSGREKFVVTFPKLEEQK